MLRAFTAFSGYDSQCMALDRLGLDYELVGWSEVDGNAIKAHDAVYPQWAGRNFGDICKVDWDAVPEFDLFTYSFPCQAISTAGKMKGLAKGSGTTSSLLWECERAVELKRPRLLVMENVPALLSDRFAGELGKWRRILEGLGYSSFTRILDARDYGVPQSRRRVFMVSVLGCEAPYHFPMPTGRTGRLSDFLDKDVEGRFYVRETRYGRLLSMLGRNELRMGKGPLALDCYSRSIHEGHFPTIVTTVRSSRNYYVVESPPDGLRYPTPWECLRLMGVSEADMGRMRGAGIGEAALYKLAGNSIVVDVLAAVLRKLLVDPGPDEGGQTELALAAREAQ